MTLSDLQYKYKIEGEKWHIERTSVMREYPFPEILKGNGFYFEESNIWRELYKDYEFFTLNYPLRTYIFSEDGIKNKMNVNPLRYETLKLGFYNTLNRDIKYFFYSPLIFIFQMSVFILYSRKDKTSFETMFFGFCNKWARALFVVCYPVSYLMPILFLTNRYKFFR